MASAQSFLAYVAAFAAAMVSVVAAYVVIQALIALLGVLLAGVLAIGVSVYAGSRVMQAVQGFDASALTARARGLFAR